MMRYYNLVDQDGESMGILETKLPYNIVDLEWSIYTNEAETSDYGIEEFIELLQEAYPNYYFERFLLDAIIDPVSTEYIDKTNSKINLNKLI
jgi:hypothetical protein